MDNNVGFQSLNQVNLSLGKSENTVNDINTSDNTKTAVQNNNGNFIFKSLEEIEEELRQFDFKGFEKETTVDVENLYEALEKEKIALLKEQLKTIEKYTSENAVNNNEVNFFEAAIKSVEEQTGRSVESILA